jgi:nicotinamide-nucleotide amidase
MMAAELETMARHVLEACAAADLTVATAESCTGGLIAAALTAIPGSSAWVDRGFVTYSNEAKADMLGVPAEMIASFGAVSEPVARAMAEGALTHSRARLSVSVTGIAGPGGGSDEKPVGTVHIAAARLGQPTLHRHCLFSGDRDAVRQASALAAMRLLIERCVR